MVLTRKMSQRKFERKHPDLRLDIHVTTTGRGKPYVLVTAYGRGEKYGEKYAAAASGTLEEALFDLSARCLKLAGLEAMDRQGWADGKTGEVGKPLSPHHIEHRSRGGNHSTDNLAGLSQDSHGFEHDKRRT
jgi:hypothetical protein